MKQLFDFDDILIEPKVLSDITSRKTFITKYKNGFLPLMTAPMDTVVCEKNIELYRNLGIVPILPRIKSPNNSYYSFDTFYSYGIEDFIRIFLTNTIEPPKNAKIYALIDTANGHMLHLYNIVAEAKGKYGDNLVLMVGNIANPKTYKEYCKIGVDYCRVGIGNGAGCFLENSIVSTKLGNKLIQDIKIGEFVLTHTGEYKEVLAVISYPSGEELIKINNTISTKNHEYYVINKKYSELITDDNIHNYAEWIKAENLTNEYFLLEYDVNDKLKKYKLKEIETIEFINHGTYNMLHDITVDTNHSYHVNDNIVHNCLTTVQSGVGYSLPNLIQDCYEIKNDNNYKTKIVADGGFKKYADIVKGLGLGADFVMLGGMFNKSLESSGETTRENGSIIDQYSEDAQHMFDVEIPLYKTFRGMSTKEVQKKWGNEELKTSEGIVKTQQVEYTLKGWVENFDSYFRTAMSYTGKKELSQFIGRVNFNMITQNVFNRFNK